MIVRHTTLDFIKLTLKRTVVLLKYLACDGVSPLGNLYTPEELGDVADRLKEEISKVIVCIYKWMMTIDMHEV